MLNMSSAPSSPATTGHRAKRMGPAPLRPTQEVNSLARVDRPRKGSRHRNTLAGRDTKIMKRPITRAGTSIGSILDGLARRPSIRNITSCISHVMPLKKLRISFRWGMSARLPIMRAVTYSASRPFPIRRPATPLAK